MLTVHIYVERTTAQKQYQMLPIQVRCGQSALVVRIRESLLALGAGVPWGFHFERRPHRGSFIICNEV